MTRRTLFQTAALLFTLAACALPGTAPRQVTVLDGQIQVRAPQFYCVDQQSARSGTDTAVVLIGRCNADGQVAAALVTVTVGRSASAGVMLASAEALRAFMSSAAGRRALARSGRSQDVEIVSSGVVEGRLMLHLKDREAGEYWRAILGVNGRLISISASGAVGLPLTPDEGRKLVEQTVEAMRAANPATAP